MFTNYATSTGWKPVSRGAALALVTVVALIAGASADAASNDPVFDVDALASTPLDAKVLKKSEADGLVTEEVQYHSHTDAGKRVDIFALLIYPAGAKNAPAVIWNQGGLAQASDY